MAPSPQEVTGLLLAWSHGEPSALDKLIPLVHDELHCTSGLSGQLCGADTAGKINPVAVQALNRSVERLSKQNWSIPFNTHKAIALPNRPGLVQSIFSPPARRSALVFPRKNLAPRRRAKNALH